jgi:hypothetical protein
MVGHLAFPESSGPIINMLFFLFKHLFKSIKGPVAIFQRRQMKPCLGGDYAANAETLFDSTCQLPLPKHKHKLNARQRALGGLKGFDPQRGVIAGEGRRVGLAPIDGDPRRHTMASNRFLQKA